jgi:N-methylhydantoinase A
MRRQAREDFARIGVPDRQLSFKPTVEMRYVGQFHEVEMDLPADELNAESLEALLKNFHAKYEKMYTYAMPWRAAELLTFRLKATAPRRQVEMAMPVRGRAKLQSARRGSRACLFDGSDARVETPAYDWDRMEPGHEIIGPALIDDKTTTVLVAPGFVCEVDAYCNLVMRAR